MDNNNAGFTLKVNTFNPSNEANGKELFGMAIGSGSFFAKKGSMVAYTGDFKFEKRLLGTNDNDSLFKQLCNHIGKKLAKENLEIMEVMGAGTVYLADEARHVTVIDLFKNNSLFIENENILAFTKGCHYGIDFFPIGPISQKGLFMTQFTGITDKSQIAITTTGNPLVIETPCSADPDAVVGWTGPSPEIKTDINYKTLFGQTSGESYRMYFNKPGHIVIVQPYERAGNCYRNNNNRSSK